jgi:hypothetical protein
MDNKHSTTSRINVRPNPASGSVEVYSVGATTMQTSQIELLTIAGKTVGQFTWNGKSLQLDVSQYPRGIYILKIRTNLGSEMKKLILQ